MWGEGCPPGELLHAVLDGDVDAESSGAVIEHLETCDAFGARAERHD